MGPRRTASSPKGAKVLLVKRARRLRSADLVRETDVATSCARTARATRAARSVVPPSRRRSSAPCPGEVVRVLAPRRAPLRGERPRPAGRPLLRPPRRARRRSRVASELEAGRLPLDHLRGRTALTHPSSRRRRSSCGASSASTGLDASLIRAVTRAHDRFELADGATRDGAAARRSELEPQRVSCRDEKVEARDALGAGGASPRRGTSCGPARSRAASSRRPRARSCPVSRT